MQFQENLYPPQGRSLEILIGTGGFKAIVFKRKFEAKVEFPAG